MADFTFYDESSAPDAAKPILAQARKEMGGKLPNIYRFMAESPELLDAYRHLRKLLMQTSLTPIEQELVQLVVSYEHECGYCMAGHSMRAKMIKTAPEDIAALRAGQPVSDEKLETLRRFTLTMVRQRGHVADAEVEAFLAAGYTRRNVLEVVLATGAKVLTNYSNHLFGTPLNDFLEPFAWTKPKR